MLVDNLKKVNLNRHIVTSEGVRICIFIYLLSVYTGYLIGEYAINIIRQFPGVSFDDHSY